MATRANWQLFTVSTYLCLVICSAAPLFGQGTASRTGASDAVIVEKINEFIRQGWEDNEINPSPMAEDGEFARRVSLDIVGHIPSYADLMEFLEDDSTDKRAKFIDKLLDHEDYIKNWTNIWGNMLIGRANNRNNRGARGPLDRFLRASFNRNLPYDEFVFELVSAEGDSDSNGAVAFLASHLNEGAVPATSITSRVFLGMQVQCTQCHNHPFNDWQQSQFWSMNAFFQGTRRSGGRQGAAIQLVDNPSIDMIRYEKRSGATKATFRKFVDGTSVRNKELVDGLLVDKGDIKPRLELAKLITDPEKPFMARTQVNRTWGHLFGAGFTKPTDDMGPHNPPTHPELVDYMAEQFRIAGYDQKRLIRWIALSESYNLSSKFGENNVDDDPNRGASPLFSKMYVKRFSAEQLYDSLIIATQAHLANRNAEAAEQQRQTWLQQFVRTFGTDENDESTSFNGTIPQALVLMNGQLIRTALSEAPGAFLPRVMNSSNGDIRNSKPAPKGKRAIARARYNALKNRGKGNVGKIETLFLSALARKPSQAELDSINDVFQKAGSRNAIMGLQDVFWAILNSNEFILNH